MTLSGEILVGVIVIVFAVLLYLNEKRHDAEKRDIMNRLMSKDYKEFATFEYQNSSLKAKEGKEEPKNLFDARDVFPVD